MLDDTETLLLRAANSLSTQPRPFIRWAGSKRALLSHIIPHLPTHYRAYHEPFLGSGALFFLLRPKIAYLNDSCTELVETYRAVQSDGPKLAELARGYEMTQERFYSIRENRSSIPLERAAELLFLNRGCFNGLYRVNGSGKFNVPWGAPKTDFVVDEPNLIACHHLLQSKGVRLTCQDFGLALKPARKGDLIFLDPPYVTKHNNNGFIDYNEKLFSWDDQTRLAGVAEKLRVRGCHVILTNANHRDVLDLYPNFEKFTLDRRSNLASATARRGQVTEAIIVGNQEVSGGHD